MTAGASLSETPKRVVTALPLGALALVALYGPMPATALIVMVVVCVGLAEARKMMSGWYMRPTSRMYEWCVYAYILQLTLLLPVKQQHGANAVFFLVLVVAFNDAGAYFTGRKIGGPKLWPRVSPGKTWSGTVGGIATAMLAAPIAMVLGLAPAFGLVTGLLVAGLCALVALAGDLAESALKRRCRVKDSGGILPGHGGILDRIDGLLPAASAYYLLAGYVL